MAALARKHDVNDNLLFKWIRLWQREGRVCRPRKNSSSLPALIDHLQAQLDKLRRMNFGSRSEKVSRRIAQMEADLNLLQQESD
ncbi:transposase, partial [Escherichia coli]|uniref:IS66 family transposase n=1 Tax=Escherichia coli TaxID=562 RepID=UPI00312C9729